MKYLKPFNESRISLDDKRVPSLKYDIEMIFIDMVDDGFKMKAHIGKYWSNIELITKNPIKLESCMNSIYHFFNYMKDDSFHIYYIDLHFENGYMVSLEDPSYDKLDRSLLNNADRILDFLKISFYPIT